MGKESRPTPSTEEDRQTLAALSGEFRVSLVNYFSRRIKETSEVEDLVQEVFVRLLGRGGVANLEHVRGYVFQTASSVLNDWLRKRQVRHADQHQSLDLYDNSTGLDGIPPAFSDQQAAAIAPEHVLIQREQLSRAMDVLMAMPERTRQVFVLRRIEGLSYREIARRLGITVSATEKQMRRAMEKLIQGLGPDDTI